MIFRDITAPGDAFRGDHQAGAIFSPDFAYRYLLWRTVHINELRACLWVMLNPSTADENDLDPTLRRCWNYCNDWGYRYMVIANLFAFRATDPKNLKAPDAITRHRNNAYLLNALRRCDTVIAGWGAHPLAQDEGRRFAQTLVRDAGEHLECLGTGKSGAPRHPLYLKRGEKPRPWSPRGHGFESRGEMRPVEMVRGPSDDRRDTIHDTVSPDWDDEQT